MWQMVGKHKHCVELHRTFTECSGSMFMVMEKCEANLMDRLHEFPHMHDAELGRVFQEMALGVAHLHKHRIVHRDIKPNNFLYGGADGQTLKLCDFGMAAFVPKGGRLLSRGCGTVPYLSPEMLGKKGHCRSTDIWSLGVTAYVMLFSRFPYMPKDATPASVMFAIVCGAPAPQYVGKDKTAPRTSVHAECFTRALLERESHQRPKVEEILAFPFLRSVDAATEGRGLLS